MKISHIIGLVIIAVAIGIIVSTAGDASTYVTFQQADSMATAGDDDKIHVVGKLKKDQSGNFQLLYNPSKDPNYFSFILVDRLGQSKQVVYSKPKPQDFEKSEQVVVVGRVNEGVFIASQILMKCPSKYENQPQAGL